MSSTTSTSDDGACPERPEESYHDCVHGESCAGSSPLCIVDDPDAPSFGICSLGCSDDCDCFVDPAGATAVSKCVPILQDEQTACVLDCSGGKSCPAGMQCLASFDICVFAAEQGETTGSTGTSESDSSSDSTTRGGTECGDGEMDPGEDCDDGNVLDHDSCTSLCKQATCGDGFVRAGVEECDDANDDDQDACRNDCVSAKCGDGVVWTGMEECDDADMIKNDGCEPDCTVTPGYKLWETKHDLYGGRLEAAAADPNGNLALVSSNFASNVGGLAWAHYVDGSRTLVDPLSFIPKGVAVASNGDVLIAGYRWSGGNFQGTAYIERRTVAGDEVWTRQYAAPYSAHAYGIAEDSTGAIVVVGDSEANAAPSKRDVWIRKYTAAGDEVWTQLHDGPIAGSMDSANAVAIDPFDDIFVAGQERGGNLWLGKFTPDGDLLWSANPYPDYDGGGGTAYAVTLRPSGEILVSGKFYVGDEAPAMWLGEFDAEGALQWSDTYAAAGTSYALALDAAGNILQAGYNPDKQVHLDKLDPTGDFIWYKRYNIGYVDHGGHGVVVGPDGHVFLAVSLGNGGYHVYLAKFTP
ncbi:DUF4215 domain-containing protein [Nannocystis sp. ILAH1]|uniref:DUF4215 domain-containing protein n=1 Tax=unclassified Nannocystis TaxID=2627009 RepID=UPI0022701527|nr:MULTISPECIES: DUF4215 domain-containing protein [unclassified Nannocystis]MCY0986534.1 DUF4215 domain-containing protein [Nannocystis sp. ILAH1]MCY1071414.1 DUF4215 domain-containing protein [Nannocystis sp. RBIL2]